MRLVDPKLPFKVVYAIYHHEYLGYLLSAHYVQSLPNDELSLVHQRAYPDNMDEFATGLRKNDRQLIQMASAIIPREIVKRFGGNPRKDVEFFMTKFEGELKKLAINYVNREMGKILPHLMGETIYIMGKDSYPAHKKINVLSEKASILFHFRRNETFTRYYPTIKLRGEKIAFQFKGAQLISLDPAWLLLNDELFCFYGEIEGKKIQPFLKKYNIEIPRAKEDLYYEKFISQIVEKYQVYAKGFMIYDIRSKPVFQLRVREHDRKSFSFIREVDYDGFVIPLNAPGRRKAMLSKDGEEFIFHRIFRDCDEEEKVVAQLQALAPNPNSLTPWEYVDKDKGLKWLSDHTSILREMGIDIIQDGTAGALLLDRPEIVMSTKEEGDWFDIQAVVQIGPFEIPFLKFRNHILHQKREYELPDGTIAILPENWFSDYLHLMEVSEVRNENSFSIKKYQAPLLNLPSQTNGKTDLLQVFQNLDEIPVVDPPQKLKAKLRNYQQAGVNWLHFMKENGMGAILADDMGLGKTLQTLTLLQKEKETSTERPTPSLIVMPTSLLQNWSNEAKKFTPDLRIHIHAGVNRTKSGEKFDGHDLILTTYGIVRQDIRFLKAFPFHYVILDESQMIKNPESKTAKAVRKLISRYRLSLTGTPIENTVMDLWSQMSFLNPGLLGNEAFFKRFYVTPIEKEKDAKKSAKLRRIIYPFILRRRKQKVEKDLPPKIEKLHYCGMTEVQQNLYDETKNTYRNYLLELISQGAWKKNKLNILTGLQKLRQIAIHPKMVEPESYELSQSGKYKEVRRLLRQIISKKRSKVLIFSQFVKMLHLLRDDLTEDGISFCYLDGSTRDRQAQVDQFQTNKEIKVFLISLKAGGVGLNLTAADYVFILDPWWNPAVENQAIDRSHRIGQDRTVFYYKFITQDSIEEKILGLQKRKEQLSDDIITVEEDFYKSLEAVDLEDLFN
ncbi:MAG: DEAD/DEAH box helicase [Bacteroidota bacterium]